MSKENFDALKKVGSTNIRGTGYSQGNWTEVTPSDNVVFSNPCSFFVVEGGVVNFRNAGNGEDFLGSVEFVEGTYIACVADKLLESTTATVIAIHSGKLVE